MKLKFLSLIFTMFLFGVVSAVGVCIDHSAPGNIGDVAYTLNSGNLNINWIAAVDLPTCSGVGSYLIYKSNNSVNFSLVSAVNNVSYSEILASYGTYEYMIHAVDFAGHEGNATSFSVIYSTPIVTTSGGGGGGHYDNSENATNNTQIIPPAVNWSCSAWSDCIDGVQQRICSDSNGNQPTRTESRECIVQNNNETNNAITTRNGFLTFTGNAIGAVGDYAKKPVGIASFVVLLGGLFFIVRRKRKKSK